MEYCIHAEDGCTASNIQDDFVLEDMLVLINRVAIGSSPNLVFLRTFSILESGLQRSQMWLLRYTPTFLHEYLLDVSILAFQYLLGVANHGDYS